MLAFSCGMFLAAHFQNGLISMSKNSRNTSTGQTSIRNGEVKNSSYASGYFFDSSWDIVMHDPLCFKD